MAHMPPFVATMTVNDDAEAARRYLNTLAARRSRAKQRDLIKSLQDTVVHQAETIAHLQCNEVIYKEREQTYFVAFKTLLTTLGTSHREVALLTAQITMWESVAAKPGSNLNVTLV